MDFYVGQPVVCVNGKPRNAGLIIGGLLLEEPDCGYPVVGQVYTVSALGIAISGVPGVDLKELPHPSRYWAASRFRPVKTTSIDNLLTVEAGPEIERDEFRRKVRESEKV